MKPRPFLIAIAAFAVTATGVQAYQGTKVLEKAGLTEEQIEAFESARELRQSGDFKAARDKLVEAGVDEETLLSVHRVMHEKRKSTHTKRFLHEELTDEERDALRVARQANDKETVRAILEEAGIELQQHKMRW